MLKSESKCKHSNFECYSTYDLINGILNNPYGYNFGKVNKSNNRDNYTRVHYKKTI